MKKPFIMVPTMPDNMKNKIKCLLKNYKGGGLR